MENSEHNEKLADEVKKKSSRKIKARRRKKNNLWYGIGMFGLVGWSVSIPTVLFLGLGIWIDSTHKSSYSWTLMMLVVGVVLGCLNAWYWIKKESENDN